MPHDLELAEHYQKYFYTVSANTQELKKLAYQLRYKVYIEDCQYNTKYNHSTYNAVEQIERDEYDDDALHALLFHKPTNQAIGNIRLIPYKPEQFDMLPLEKHGNLELFDEIDRVDVLRTRQGGEVSRVCLLKSFRQRRFDQIYLSGTTCEVEEIKSDRRYPINYLPLCLCLMALQYKYQAGLSYSLAMMEKPLATLIRHYGIQYRQIGPFREYYGRRAPFLISRQGTYDNLLPGVRKLFETISEELSCDAPAAISSAAQTVGNGA